MILLNPGPANTTPSVKEAQVVPDICPRERDFVQVLATVCDSLARLVDERGDCVAVPFAGSGTAAVEACIASMVPADGRLLVIDNGPYGARMAEIADAYGLNHRVLRFGTGTWIDVEEVERAMSTFSPTQVAMVHHETSTGMLNPVEAVGYRCRQRAVELLVDTMSSFAGVPFSMESLGASAVVASANKCLHGMPGLSFVILGAERAASMVRAPGRSLYLSIGEQQQFLARTGQMRFTPPVQTVYALSQALRELDAEGGVRARAAHYRSCWAALDSGVRRLGFERLLPESQLSHILTAYLEPTHPTYSYRVLHDELFTRGFTIYPGKGASRATFRLANMGAVTVEDMHAFVRALEEVIEAQEWRPLYLSAPS